MSQITARSMAPFRSSKCPASVKTKRSRLSTLPSSKSLVLSGRQQSCRMGARAIAAAGDVPFITDALDTVLPGLVPAVALACSLGVNQGADNNVECLQSHGGRIDGNPVPPIQILFKAVTDAVRSRVREQDTRKQGKNREKRNGAASAVVGVGVGAVVTAAAGPAAGFVAGPIAAKATEKALKDELTQMARLSKLDEAYKENVGHLSHGEQWLHGREKLKNAGERRLTQAGVMAESFGLITQESSDRSSDGNSLHLTLNLSNNDVNERIKKSVLSLIEVDERVAKTSSKGSDLEGLDKGAVSNIAAGDLYGHNRDSNADRKDLADHRKEALGLEKDLPDANSLNTEYRGDEAVALFKTVMGYMRFCRDKAKDVAPSKSGGSKSKSTSSPNDEPCKIVLTVKGAKVKQGDPDLQFTIPLNNLEEKNTWEETFKNIKDCCNDESLKKKLISEVSKGLKRKGSLVAGVKQGVAKATKWIKM